jgi:hypothetical protein
MSKPKWWLEHVAAIEASLAALSAYESNNTNITIYDDGQGDERRRLYGSGSIAIRGVNIGVFAEYVAARFPDHLCVAALVGEKSWPVTDDTLRRIEETIDLTVKNARQMLKTQLTPKFREWMQEQRRKPRVPRPCSICHRLTDDAYALSGGNGYPIICPNCHDEGNLMGHMQSCGWLNAYGKITPEFRRARKRHFRSVNAG